MSIFDTRSLLRARGEFMDVLFGQMTQIIGEGLSSGIDPTALAEILGTDMARHMQEQPYDNDAARLEAACSIIGHALVRLAQQEGTR